MEEITNPWDSRKWPVGAQGDVEVRKTRGSCASRARPSAMPSAHARKERGTRDPLSVSPRAIRLRPPRPVPRVAGEPRRHAAAPAGRLLP